MRKIEPKLPVSEILSWGTKEATRYIKRSRYKKYYVQEIKNRCKELLERKLEELKVEPIASKNIKNFYSNK